MKKQIPKGKREDLKKQEGKTQEATVLCSSKIDRQNLVLRHTIGNPDYFDHIGSNDCKCGRKIALCSVVLARRRYILSTNSKRQEPRDKNQDPAVP